jgi:hypothetical protein
VRDLAKLFRTSSWPLANAKAVVASLTSSVYHKHRLFARHYTRSRAATDAQASEHLRPRGPGLMRAPRAEDRHVGPLTH